MAQYAFYFDSNKCSGCKTCQVACKETYKLPVNNLYRKVLNYQGGHLGTQRSGQLRAQRRVRLLRLHGVQPLRRSGVRGELSDGRHAEGRGNRHRVDRSRGVHRLQDVPDRVPLRCATYDDEAGYMLKCDMCKAELEAGGSKPLCVTGCPMRALDFGTREDMIAKYGEGDVEVEPLPKDTTHPNLIMNPHRDAQKSGSGTGALVNLEEEI